MRALSDLEIKQSKLEQQIHTNDMNLQAKDEEIAGLKAIIQTLREQHVSALKEVDVRGERLVLLKKSYENSTSWRLTRPLRWLAERMQGSPVAKSTELESSEHQPMEVAVEPDPADTKVFKDEAQLLDFLQTHRQDYGKWVDLYDSESPGAPAESSSQEAPCDAQSKISVISVFTDLAGSQRSVQAMESVRTNLHRQQIAEWEWLIGGYAMALDSLQDWAKTDPRIRLIEVESESISPWAILNEALQKTTGQWIIWIDERTQLREHAFQAALDHLKTRPSARALYADDDRIDDQRLRSAPNFRCDLNPDLLLTTDYLGQFVLCMREDLIEAGGWDASLRAAHRHDLLLRLAERWKDPAQAIIHLPHILSHRREWSEGAEVGTAVLLPCWTEAEDRRTEEHDAVPEVVQAHLARRRLNGVALPHPTLHCACRVRFTLPETPPRVGIVIPTRDNVGVLSVCLESLL
ncbi:MAG TPA: hypothetical protein VFY22_09845, partial [Hydrogenophaga sp.]|nr:hypothetical protein [Hydrogenophaga sp.]